eukprot:GILK01004475.1.p1 GENE.GILK01004475.1~~GILK01004475.1.p1  ORF type:complete len:603 (+),score=82.09 GILK01004475.1:115-1809(+)
MDPNEEQQQNSAARARAVVIISLLVFSLFFVFSTPDTSSNQKPKPKPETELEAEQEAQIQFNTHFPASVVGTFRGDWSVQSYPGDSLAELGFEGSTGTAFFHVESTSTPALDVKALKCEMVLRNGIYANQPPALRLSLQGLYMRNQGKMILHGKSIDNTLIPVDHSVDSHFISSSLLNATDMTQFTNGSLPQEDEKANTCFVSVVFVMEPPIDSIVDLESDEVHSGEQDNYVLSGSVASPNCHLALTVNGTKYQYEATYNKAVDYTMMVTFVSFVQVLFIMKQMEFSNTPAAAAKMSLWCVGQQALLDSYLCLLHLTVGILWEPLFGAFGTAAFFQFVIFSIFEMRYIILIWRARRPQPFADGWHSVRRELGVLYTRFYGMLLAGLFIMYQFQNFLPYLIVLLYCFWVPQIVLDAIKGQKNSLHPLYLIGMSATRLAVPLYFYGCPKNFLMLEPNIPFCQWLVGVTVLQIAVIFAQRIFGPRFFVPKVFLPKKYNYYRQLPMDEHHDEENPSEVDCVICMVPMQSEGSHMVTPCGHMFHAECLQQWMDIKMECPTCRTSLPPLD